MMAKESIITNRTVDDHDIPDLNFRIYVSDEIDTDGNGFLSDEEVLNTTRINISNRGIALKAEMTGEKSEFFVIDDSFFNLEEDDEDE